MPSMLSAHATHSWHGEHLPVLLPSPSSKHAGRPSATSQSSCRVHGTFGLIVGKEVGSGVVGDEDDGALLGSDPVGFRVGAVVGSELAGDSVGSDVVGNIVGPSVGPTVGSDVVGGSVGKAVGEAEVGNVVGSDVGGVEGPTVGFCVGGTDGTLVGSVVLGAAVGPTVNSSGVRPPFS